MIVVPGKCVYVGSPRSGSHFIYDVLEKAFPMAQRGKEHHAFISEVLTVKRMLGLPIYTVVRDPCEQLFSFYWNSLRKYKDRVVTTTFREFIEGRKPPQDAPYNRNTDFPPGALCTYRDVADRFFPFELNFVTLFNELGITDLPHVEPTRVATEDYLAARNMITEEDRQLVYKYFEKDYAVMK